MLSSVRRPLNRGIPLSSRALLYAQGWIALSRKPRAAYARSVMRKRIFLLPGLLLAVSVFATACGGSDADLTAIATEAADVQPQTELTVVAEDLEFDTDTIVVPAGEEVSLTLDNQDSNAMHNIAVYVDEGGEREEVFRGDLFEGVESRTYTFTSPEAGVYLFRCDAHPDMNGAFIAR